MKNTTKTKNKIQPITSVKEKIKKCREHIPFGCRACGGPYPMCKSSCPMFDD